MEEDTQWTIPNERCLLGGLWTTSFSKKVVELLLIIRNLQCRKLSRTETNVIKVSMISFTTWVRKQVPTCNGVTYIVLVSRLLHLQVVILSGPILYLLDQDFVSWFLSKFLKLYVYKKHDYKRFFQIHIFHSHLVIFQIFINTFFILYNYAHVKIHT